MRDNEPIGPGDTPAGEEIREAGAAGRLGAPESRLFVVQKHHASTLHFDLRLQVGDVLASWAVPKGPSLDPRDRRLAVRTDDHQLEHAEVEGLITGGRRASTVIIWDRGTFVNLTEVAGALVPTDIALDAGHLRFRLHGERLQGAFALTRTGMNGDERNWILVKIDDEGADRGPTITAEQRSLLTGRTNDDIARQAQ